MLRAVAVLLCLGCLFAEAGAGEDVFAKARKAISPQKDFRVAMRNVTVTRDEETGRSLCTIVLGASWDKKLSPLLIQQSRMGVAFAKDASGKSLTEETSAQGPARIAGRADTELKVQVPAPPRSSSQIDVLKGQVTFTTPARLLVFGFPSLKLDRPDKQTIEGVTVTLDKVALRPDRMSVDLTIENPKGTPNFETFLTSVWLENAVIFRTQKQGSMLFMDGPLEKDGELLEPLTPLRARIRYHFTGAKSSAVLENWSLLFTTTGPIVEIPVPFELKNIPLP